MSIELDTSVHFKSILLFYIDADLFIGLILYMIGKPFDIFVISLLALFPIFIWFVVYITFLRRIAKNPEKAREKLPYLLLSSAIFLIPAVYLSYKLYSNTESNNFNANLSSTMYYHPKTTTKTITEEPKPIEFETYTVSSNAPTYIVEKMKLCPQCGQHIPENATQCPLCSDSNNQN